jgi:hypothetical protein
VGGVRRGTTYGATSERAIPTHGDGANRNDSKYIDNSKTFHAVVKTNTIRVDLVGNYPDVAEPATPQQMQAWLVLVRFLQGALPDTGGRHLCPQLDRL